MKNKIWVFVVAFIATTLFSINDLWAQNFPVHLQIIPRNILITSIDGVIAENVYTLTMRTDWNREITEPWSIAVRISNPITSGNITVPSEKISIRFNKISGGINLGDVGVDNGTRYVLSDVNFKPLIINTNVDLKTSKTYGIDFDIIVDGGDYLEKVKKTTKFPFSLTFLVTIGNQTTELSQNIDFQIDEIKGSFATYGIIVNTAAGNGLLELKTMRDYIEGVSQTYKDGLSVISTTDYSIEVRSLKNNFEAGNNTVPVNAVSLELKDSRNNGGGTIVLSENTQTVFNTTATGKQARLFDIRYFTTPNDERLINATPASYQTTLMYTLVPK